MHVLYTLRKNLWEKMRTVLCGKTCAKIVQKIFKLLTFSQHKDIFHTIFYSFMADFSK